MKNHRFIYLHTHIVLFLIFSFLSLSCQTNKTAKPNILWLIAEDMSPDLGCYGNTLVTTPNLDQLAAKGMRFTNMYVTGPACSPSRTALATGVSQTTLGAYHMRYPDHLKPELHGPVKVLPRLMRDNGYFTGNIRGIRGFGSGKDDWLFKKPEKAWDTNSWDELIAHQPFFAQINMKESHRAFTHGKHRISEKDVKLPPYYPDHPVAQKDWAGYLESVNLVDEHVGAILDQLKQDGLAENTIVVFISDHGRLMMRAKNWLYDSGTRIPMIIYYPKGVARPAGFQTGGVDSQLISTVDLTAETVHMSGGEIPDWMQGQSFLGKDTPLRQHIFTAIDRVGNIDSRSRAVRTQRFKYIRNFKTPGSVNECSTPYRRAMHPIYHLLNIMGEKNLLTPVQAQMLKPIAEEELYDLENDPHEINNLIGQQEYESVHKELHSKLLEWIDISQDKGFEEDSEEIVQYFQNYGVTEMEKRQEKINELRSVIEADFK